MSRLITSAMNQAGTWQDEPNDQAKLLAYQTNQRNHEDDWRKQLAMAQMTQNQHQFDATNAQQNDQFNKSYAMQDGLAAAQINSNTMDRQDSADRYGKQFDYMSGRDKMNDDFRAKAFDLGNARYEQERTDNEPYRAAAARRMLAGEGLDKQQSDLMAMDLEERKARKAAANGYAPTLRSPLTGTTKEAYDEAFGSTGDAKQATAAANAMSRSADAKSAERAGTALGNAAANYNDRAGEWFDSTGRNTSEDQQRVMNLFNQYKSALVKSGENDADADLLAKSAIDRVLTKDPLIGSGVNDLRKALGLPGVK